MSKRKKRKNKKIIKAILTVIAMIMVFFLYQRLEPSQEANYDIPEGTAEFHFIDVGQGDATLIMVDGKSILIDTGDRGSEDRKKLTDYLAKMNVTELEYFVATHPDSDHIGSAAYVIENYNVKNVILSPKEHTSKTYENFIAAIEEREQINVINPQDMLGESIMVGELEMKILGPIGDPDKMDNNEASVVIMARWGKTKVLLTGDAEKESEEKLEQAYKNELDCDVLKVGHHGSSTSSQNSFIAYVKPEYAVISCGVDNDYGHPHKEALDVLNGIEAEIYRTDLQGSIVASTDGERVTFKTEK